ncbi:hypothetical protein L7F22_014038 [Adiantum nelumboides]|nr:hypothetical protein [Adiantum nelumboides]
MPEMPEFQSPKQEEQPRPALGALDIREQMEQEVEDMPEGPAKEYLLYEKKVMESAALAFLQPDEQIKDFGNDFLPLPLMRHEAILWKEKMRPAVPRNEEGGYEGIPLRSEEAQTLIEDHPRWRKKWLSERPRDLTNFHNTPQHLQIDPTYCRVPRRRSWAEFQKWKGKNKALLNYPRSWPLEEVIPHFAYCRKRKRLAECSVFAQSSATSCRLSLVVCPTAPVFNTLAFIPNIIILNVHILLEDAKLQLHPLLLFPGEQQLPTPLGFVIMMPLHLHLHLHQHRPSPLYLFSLPFPCRGHSCSIKLGCFKQIRITAHASANKGRHLQIWNGDQFPDSKDFKERLRKHAILSWAHATSSCSWNHNTLNALKEAHKVDRQALMLPFKVAAGLLGVVSLVTMRRFNAKRTIQTCFTIFWIYGRRGLHVTTPLHLGQFSTLTLALNRPLFLWTRTLNLGFVKERVPRFTYLMDVLFEQHPITYILLLTTVCLTLIGIGGFLFTKFRSFKQKPGDSFWDAWACICSSGTHLKEKTGLERGIGLVLAVGGLLFYSLLTSTMTAQFKSRMEWLREGAHSEVMEEGHVLICGTNNHLGTVLRQLNKSHQIALREHLTKIQKRTVLLISENERKITEEMVSDTLKDLLQLNVLIRSGSLSNTASFEKVGASKAQSIIVLASDANKYEADGESLLTVLALQPLLDNSFGKLVVEVFNASTAELLKSSTGLKINTLLNLSSKILVQCSRQPGLFGVYQELLEHDKQVLNVRSFPILAGITYLQLRRGFPQAIVCGLVREGMVNFHPPDHLMIKENDKVLMICGKEGYKNSFEFLIESSKSEEKLAKDTVSTSLTPSVSKAPKRQAGPKERILMLGWQPRVSEMIREFDEYVGPGTELIILAETPKEEREYILSRKIRTPLRNVRIIHQVGNPMSRTDVKAAILHPLPVMKLGRSVKKSKMLDNTKIPLSILVIADSTWRAGDKSSPDKKSVLALLLAEDVCQKLVVEVNSLVAEFVDYKLGKQIMNLRPDLKAIGTNEIVGLVTAQVAEQSELGDVWTDLLNSWGDEIYMKDINRYRKAGEAASFSELAEQAQLRKEIAIGYTIGDQTVINPSSKNIPLHFSKKDSLVVISEYQYT